MYKNLLLAGLVICLANNNALAKATVQPSKIVAPQKIGRCKKLCNALWTKRSKKARVAIIFGTANLLYGLFFMQMRSAYEDYRIWRTDKKFKLSLPKKIINLLPKALQAQLFAPCFVAHNIGISLQYNPFAKCIDYIEENFVFEASLEHSKRKPKSK